MTGAAPVVVDGRFPSSMLIAVSSETLKKWRFARMLIRTDRRNALLRRLDVEFVLAECEKGDSCEDVRLLRLHYLCEQPVCELAQREGMSEKDCRNALTRIKRRIKTQYQELREHLQGTRPKPKRVRKKKPKTAGSSDTTSQIALINSEKDICDA